MCSQTQELLQNEYSTLMTLIEQNRQQAFFILNAQKEAMKRQLQQLYEDAENYQSKSAAVVKEIKELNTRQDSENPASLLVNIQLVQYVWIYHESNISAQY